MAKAVETRQVSGSLALRLRRNPKRSGLASCTCPRTKMAGSRRDLIQDPPGELSRVRLGIDFGTTRTVVATAEAGRYSVVAFETDAGFADYLPGVAVCTPDILCFGFEAMGLMHQAQAVVRSVKRSASQVPHDQPVPELQEIGPSALDLVIRYLSFVRRMLLQSSNLEVEAAEPLQAMVAVPANASTRQRYLTLEAFQRAGFEVLGMVNEPTAAAIEFARRNFGVLARRSPKRYVVVYDLGGGTFDTAAVSLDARRFELIASAGIARLGGEDFDEIILELTLSALGIKPNQLDRCERVRALELCREAKETMSPSNRRLLVDLGGVLPDCDPAILSTAELHARCHPLVDRTIEKLQEVFHQLRGRNIDPDNPRELGAVYLVGGGSAFPLVPLSLRKLRGRKIQLAPQPHAATAIGLAIAADPQAQVFVRESTTRHFGVWREAWDGREQSFDCILTKDQAPDDGGSIVVKRWYRPTHNIGQLRFLECSQLTAAGQPAGDLTPWCEVYFPYDADLRNNQQLGHLQTTRLAERGDEIVETYTYDNDGSIAVQIENLTQHYHRSFLLGRLR
jgi:molecular chaperone HscA